MVGFIKDTKVLSINNEYVNIQDLQIGDKVISYDEESKEFKLQDVVGAMRHSCNELVHYTFENGVELYGCEDLVFLTTDGYKENIEVGDEVITVSGTTHLINEEFLGPSELGLFELDIEEIDNYVVDGIIVHNAMGGSYALTVNMIYSSSSTYTGAVYLWVATSQTGTYSYSKQLTRGSTTSSCFSIMSSGSNVYKYCKFATISSGTLTDANTLSITSYSPTSASHTTISQSGKILSYRVYFTGTGINSGSTTTTIAFAPAAYTITYNTNGGNSISSSSAVKLPYPLPTPTKANHRFLGWYFGNSSSAYSYNIYDKASTNVPISSNTYLYAKWERTSSNYQKGSKNNNIREYFLPNSNHRQVTIGSNNYYFELPSTGGTISLSSLAFEHSKSLDGKSLAFSADVTGETSVGIQYSVPGNAIMFLIDESNNYILQQSITSIFEHQELDEWIAGDVNYDDLSVYIFISTGEAFYDGANITFGDASGPFYPVVETIMLGGDFGNPLCLRAKYQPASGLWRFENVT